MLQFFIILIICNTLHLLSAAAASWAAGVKIKEIALGFGPTLLRYKSLTLKLVPLTGYLKFLDTRDLAPSDDNITGAFDLQPTSRQIMIVLTGSTVQLLLATVLLGQSAWQDFLAFPEQYVMGALSPFELAPSLLRDAYHLIQSTPLLTLLGIVAAKMAAYHLLPLAGFNGLQIIGIVVHRLGLDQFAPKACFKFIAVITLVSGVSWCAAIVEAIRH